MIFAAFPLDEALGTIVAHSHRLPDRVLKKGGVLDEAALAALPDATVVAAGDMVATVKIIPFAVPGAALERVEAVAREASAFALHPFRKLRTGPILTELPGLKESVTEGTIEATEARGTGFGGTLLPPLRCPPAEAPVAAGLRQL